jgi:hypothetical protein
MDTLYSTGGTSYKIDPCQSKFFDPSLVVPEHQELYEVKHMSDTEKFAYITCIYASRGSYIDPEKAQATAELLGSIYSAKKIETEEESQKETVETRGGEENEVEAEQNTDSADNSQEKSEESSEQHTSESTDTSTGEVTDEEKTSTDSVK